MPDDERRPRTSGARAKQDTDDHATVKVRPDKDADATFREKWKKRRAAKKARIAAMSRRRRIARRVGILSTWLLGFVAVSMVGAVVLFYTLSDVPRPETLPLPQVSTILYSDGTVMARVGTVNRISVSIDQVPEPVRWDVLAAEDRNFYNEPGVSVSGTLRAAINDLTGGDTEGGSGITQQYVKNAYLSNSRTLSRKLKELAIAVKLSRDYTKDQILEFYLNTVYFGRGAYGIQAASQAFFGKDVSKLDVAEGAVLAALLRAPSYYDPAVNPADAKERWRYVIAGMVSTGHLSQAQADAISYPVVIKPKATNGLTVSGPKALIVQRVIAELEANGVSEEEIYARGLTIRTTINHKAQMAAEKAVSTTFSGLTKQQRNMKNALIAVSPSTGGVLAYYGGPSGTNYAGKTDYYDYAGLGFAAPGSSFKPYTLATALEQTLTKKSKGKPVAIDSIANGSQCTTIQGTKICNDPSDKQYSSAHIKVANAMKYSLNTTFDLMALEAGPANVATTARAAGISKTINGHLSLTNSKGDTTFGIGIGDYPVHPMDQAVGFSTFANDGVANTAHFVQSATASDGEAIYTFHNTAKRAFDAKVANDVTLTMEPIAGFSGVALADGRPSAAKTGTEGIQVGKYAGGNSDAWMVGFTPQVAAAVWVGSGDSTTPIVNAAGSPEYGRDLPGKTWKLFMDTWLQGQPNMALPTKQLIKATTSPTKTATATRTSTPASTSSRPTHVAPSTTSSTPTTSAPVDSDTPTTTPPDTASTTPTPSCSPGLILPDCPGPSDTPPSSDTSVPSTPPVTTTAPAPSDGGGPTS